MYPGFLIRIITPKLLLNLLFVQCWSSFYKTIITDYPILSTPVSKLRFFIGLRIEHEINPIEAIIAQTKETQSIVAG